MQILKRLADNTNESSLATELRRKRFSFFLSLFETVPKPLRILDVGGTTQFWEQMHFANIPGVEILLLNVLPTIGGSGNCKTVCGDGCDMKQFRDKEFDIVFSNSVIEHVAEKGDQQRMAREIERVGKRYFVQTPNYYFPIEPHFLFPFFQFLPVSWRVFLLQHFSLGWAEKVPSRESAEQVVRGIRLLNRGELQKCFPGASIYEEKFFGITKSFIAYAGWS